MQAIKQINCEYCGNNPVPHFLTWYFESLNVLFTPLRQLVLKNVFTTLLGKLVKKINLVIRLVKIFAIVGIVSFNTNKEKCKVGRAKVLWEEAENRGMEVFELLLFGKPIDVYLVKNEISGKKEEMIFSGLPRPSNSNSAKIDLMDDKALLKKILTQAGLPVPKGGSAWNFTQAKKIFESIQSLNTSLPSPVIVKPRLGSRGRHSTTYIYNLQDLKKAFNIAKQLCFWVIVEEMIEGPVYRATVIDYKLRGVLRGDSPKVTGDGKLTIKDLVHKRNALEHLGSKDIILDEFTEKFVKRQIQNKEFLNSGSVALNYIPKIGEVINLSEKIGVNYGGSSSEDILITHSDNKEIFEKAAKVVGDVVVGFDFIIQDITKSYKEQKSGFIEANSLPFINLHHDPLYGTSQNVAGKVWDMMEAPKGLNP